MLPSKCHGARIEYLSIYQFNENRGSNTWSDCRLFKDEQGLDSEAQIIAFEDTWHWSVAAEHTYHHLITRGSDAIASMMTALRSFIMS